MIHLRPYQREILNAPAISTILRALMRGDCTGGSVLVVSPTGSGKTAMFGSIAELAERKRLRVLILTHREEILGNTLKALYQLGVTCGQVRRDSAMTLDAIQVGMVQTVVHRLALMRRPDIIMVDEAHHYQLGRNFWGRVLSYWTDVPRLGWTATPELLSGVGMGESYAQMVEGPQVGELVRDGWLALPRMLCAPSDLLGQRYHVERGDFSAREQAAKVRERRVVGDQIEQYRQFFRGDPCVGFAPTLEIAEEYVEAFRSAGFTSSMVRSGMDKRERERAFKKLGDGSLNMLWNHSIITEGVDVPVTRGVLLLRKTQSLALYMQMAGRALRPVWLAGFNANTATDEQRRSAMVQAGKTDAIILDPVGNYQQHGHILTPRHWSLEAVSRAERGEKPPTTTTCPKCYGIWAGRPRTCPSCGYEFGESTGGSGIELKHVAGELVEIGVDETEADSMAGMYAEAMRLDPTKRARMLARRGVEELRKAAGVDLSPTAEAWRWREGR